VSGNAFLGTYWDAIGRDDITDSNIRHAVKFAAKMLKYEERGIPINRVDTHSLRSGGACTLSIAGYLDWDIMKMGQWSPNSKAFMEYILTTATVIILCWYGR